MGDHWKSIEFESEIDAHGNIHVPPEMRRQFEGVSGARIHVRLTGHLMDSALKKKGVSEEEIDRIKSLQLEPRDQVVKFLLSEGALTRNRRIRGKSGRPRRSRGRGTKR